MRLRDLCSEFWDDIVALMDYVVLGKLYGHCNGCSHYEYLKAYLKADKRFIYKLCRYFNLDMEDRDVQMFIPAAV